MGCRVNSRHLQRNNRVTSAFNGVAHNTVHMPVIDQRARMTIIRAQNEVSRIKPFLGDGCDLAFDIIPRRPQPHHGAHPLTHPRNTLCFGCGFLIVSRPAGHIGCEIRAQIRRGIMPPDRFPSSLCRCNFGQHFWISGCNTGEIHHFTQPNDARPSHRLGHVLGGDFPACGFHSGRGRRTGRHLRKDVNGLH